MYINKEELDRRLNKTSLQVNQKVRKERKEEGRLDNTDRAIIGVLSEVDTQKNIADLLGVTQTTVSNNSRGMIAPASGINKELKTEVNKGIAKIKEDRLESEKQIQDILLTNLSNALSQVAVNLDSTDAPEASKIALDMSKILERVNGDKEQKGNRTAIIINVPAMKEEKAYTSMVV